MGNNTTTPALHPHPLLATLGSRNFNRGAIGLSLVGLAAWGWVTWHPAAGQPKTDSVRSNPTLTPEGGIIRKPERKAQQPRLAAAASPEVPTHWDAPPPITVRLTTQEQHGARNLQQHTRVISRTAQKVHISSGNGQTEWLFVRSPIAPHRVSAKQTEHPRQTIIDYSDSELQLAGLARGWVDVVSFGVLPESLNQTALTGNQKIQAGFVFHERRAALTATHPLQELWWNEEAVLPLRISRHEGAQSDTSTFEVMQKGVDETLLQLPEQRFPRYTVVDITDFREAHAEHAHSHPTPFNSESAQ